jgi:muconolactone delta-isomerase
MSPRRNQNKKMTTTEITARAKAFAREGVRTHRFQIEGETVRVWDEVAGHFTTCHSLSESAEARIRKLAA